ncbi:MAG: hypothetical protein EHM41_06690 [Chloroflexi bacterium]|nr:MAG: hypothetical protein EHM41_06690 [Chloroflexota bacterium]
MVVSRFLSRAIVVIYLVLYSFLAVSCSSSDQLSEPIQPREIPVHPGDAVVVRVNSGQIDILGTDENVVGVEGELADPGRTEVSIENDDGHIQINAETEQSLYSESEEVLNLEIQVPQGISMTVVTMNASVNIHGISGTITVDSIAGDILAEDLSGVISLRSGRGDVRVVDSSGEVRVLGEHGLLSLENLHGTVGSSTIMGTIQYNGRVVTGDDIRMEVDHGPVEIQLASNSDAVLNVTSTSGGVRCPPGFESTARTCQGELGRGEGQITVRTVSGQVTVRFLNSDN